MKKLSKILLVLIIITSCFIVMSVQVLASEELDYTQDNANFLSEDIVDQGTIGESLYWSIDSNYKLIISGEGEMPNYNTASDSPWYNYSSLITAIDIGTEVTTIGNHAFSDCSGLTEITIPDSVMSIGVRAFSGCGDLRKITIPNRVKSIGSYSFSGCSGLTEITIPDSVTSIGIYAFRNCSGLTEIAIPNRVISIVEGTFYSCSGLTEITIPNSVKSIGSDAFSGCSGLTEITIPNSVKSIGNYAFRGCSGLTEITIPDSVTSIGDSAFANCSGLTEITIPDSVMSIGDRAFYGCSGLTEITIPDSVTSIGSYAFSSCNKIEKATTGQKGLDALSFTSNLKEVKLLNVASIGNNKFFGCSGLTEITIPDSVTSIGIGAFSGCSGLTEITIPDGVTGIGGYAFSGCSGLTEITIPDNVTSIENNVFEGCSGLTEITIPNSVTSIESDAFYDCSGLTEITIPDSVTSIGYAAFSDCNNLQNAIILGNVKFGVGVFPYGTNVIYEKYLEYGTVSLSENIFIYNGEGHLPKVAVKTYLGIELEPETDFTVIYNNNLNVGTATVTVTGIGNYSGTVTKTFTIGRKALTDADVKMAYIETSYDGTAKKPGVTISGLKEGTDFTVSYKDNTNAGTATVTVTGIGNYDGVVTKTFEIIKTDTDNLFDGKNKLRIYGPNRYDTSVDTADALKKSLNISKFDNIIIADGRGYADALAGAYLAKVKNAPILVVGDDAASQKLIREYVASNLKSGGTVYILGGTGAVSEKFEQSLNAKAYKIRRLGGKDRYQTNLMILNEAGVGNEDILICSGLSFADSLSASAVGKPILLVGDKLNSDQIKYLKTLSKRKYYIIGGTGAVSSTVETELKGYGSTQRVSGANRYSTSIEVANTFFGNDCKVAVLAYGLNFPDGLSGGPLAMSLQGPLILVTSTDTTSAIGYVKNGSINKLVTLGGPALISDKAIDDILK